MSYVVTFDITGFYLLENTEFCLTGRKESLMYPFTFNLCSVSRKPRKA